MRRLVAALAAFALTATAALAATFTSPGPGTPERKAILDVLRPAVERELGVRPIEFVVEEIRVGGGWAFVRANPQRKGGGAIRNPDPNMDGVHTEAFLQRQGGRWVLVEYGVGSTDVWFLGFCETTPPGLMGGWCRGM